MVINTSLKETYQKESKIHTFELNNHYYLKCFHCFSHHKTIATVGSRRDFWFSFHTSGHTCTCSVHTYTHTRCAGEAECGQ